MHVRKEVFMFVIRSCEENKAANEEDETTFGPKKNKIAIQRDAYITLPVVYFLCLFLSNLLHRLID